jgi:hypothetical protein
MNILPTVLPRLHHLYPDFIINAANQDKAAGSGRAACGVFARGEIDDGFAAGLASAPRPPIRLPVPNRERQFVGSASARWLVSLHLAVPLRVRLANARPQTDDNNVAECILAWF